MIVIPGWCVGTRPQTRNCASGNFEISDVQLHIVDRRFAPSGMKLYERLRIKPEMHDVAVSDDIFLAFQPQLAGIAGAGFA
jgi:hypothetical protein